MGTSHSLLITLGNTWQVVPEAFFHDKYTFKAVHCLTTSGKFVQIKPVFDFFKRHPDVEFTLTQIDGFRDLKTREDHQRFEEVLFRWYLMHRKTAPLPVVCLAGGYKSMSAAIQKAASLFGAFDTFHVLADKMTQPDGKSLEPQTVQQIEQARKENKLLFISLGCEPGWPSIVDGLSDKYKLINLGESKPPHYFSVKVDDYDASYHVREALRQISDSAEAYQKRISFPFVSLALWPPDSQQMLNQSIQPEQDRIWVQNLPKIELHCHLGGFATHGALLEQVRQAGETLPHVCNAPVEYPCDWPEPAVRCELNDYRKMGDATGSTLLKNPDRLRKHIQLLYEHLIEDHVVYAEIRCSPNNYKSEERSAFQVLTEIQQIFQKCMDSAKASDNHYCHVNLIVIATRKSEGDLSDISRHLALAITAAQHMNTSGLCRIVGVDLAGFEAVNTRPAYFETDFQGVHRCGIAVTAHAGENDNVESIWQAVFKLHARRLGHALTLQDAPDLFRTVVERRIGIEMCPYANYQIKGFKLPGNTHEKPYPLLAYLKAGALVTVNTDNIGISKASLSDNLLFLAKLCPGITRMELLRLQANALEVAFINHEERENLRARMENDLSPGTRRKD